ncbi:Na/Pi symporter [bacterium]|nr:Na/Pi symporter [bacterium]
MNRLSHPEENRFLILAKIFLLFALVYIFLVSISAMGAGLKLLGMDLVKNTLAGTSNAYVGLFIGILATSIIQSSSTTTSITVGLVGSGMMTLDQAIPIIMGANIGTSVTNLLVSMGHIKVRPELERAFAAAVVHDCFNILTVIIFFPLQIKFNLLSKAASYFELFVEEAGGLKFVSPLKLIVEPAIDLIEKIFAHNGWVIVVVSLVLLFVALRYIVVIMKSLVLERLSVFFDRYIFRNWLIGLTVGMIFTAIVQSSSVTTSLVVPLAAAGLVTLEQIFPYTLGANVGTTVTALLASLITQNPTAVAVALAHLLFNVFGIIVFLPLKIVPIYLARKLAQLSFKHRWFPVAYVLVVFIIIPIILIQIMR